MRLAPDTHILKTSPIHEHRPPGTAGNLRHLLQAVASLFARHGEMLGMPHHALSSCCASPIWSHRHCEHTFKLRDGGLYACKIFQTLPVRDLLEVMNAPHTHERDVLEWFDDKELDALRQDAVI